MNVLYGLHQPDEGEIRLEGEPVRIESPRRAIALGIGMVHQHFMLVPVMTVAENLVLGSEPHNGPLLDYRSAAARTRELSERFGLAVDPEARVEDLSVGTQQRVEILRALFRGAKVLVLDEPTAVLTAQESQDLFRVLRTLRDEGTSIVFISHKLNEVLDVSDRVTVLRRGKKVDTVQTEGSTERSLASLMVGREVLLRVEKPEHKPGEPLLQVRDLHVADDRGLPAVRGLDLEVRAGEIVGLAGLQGSGRTELARALFGADVCQGTIEVDGKRVGRGPRAGIRAGMGFITEDRKLEGLALAQPIRDNTLLALRALGGKQRRRLPNTVSVQELARSVELRAQSLEQEVRFLSGGNQQKVVLAKWLAVQPGVLIFDEPTRGVDVGAKAGIHDLMRGLAREGVAILMISSEMPELIGLADRILVMRNGELAGELPAGAAETDIMHLAAADEPVGAGA
jgi:general nucleoside transport system ATP-binding protein